MSDDKKKKVDLSSRRAIEKEFGKVISKGRELVSSKKKLKHLSVSPSLDLALNGGILEGSWNIISGDPKTGKEQPISAIVYTPSGPVKMGDLSVGQNVCTPDGKTANISKIHKNGVKDVYRLTFNDGTFAECGLDHLWKVGTNYHGRVKEEILTLYQIIKRGLYFSDRPRFKIQLSKEVFFAKRDVPIDPYILGALIGDGGMTAGSVIITNNDHEIVDYFKSFCSDRSLVLKQTKENGIGYRISCCVNFGDNSLINDLRSLNLYGCSSHDKFIPDDYKYNSIDLRYSLIQGLMDTDGSNNNGRSAEYTTVSKRLAYDFIEIVQSLGFTAKISQRSTSLNGKSFSSYRIYIAGNNISDLFRTSRKSFEVSRKKVNLFRTIRSIEKVRTEECRCIELDNEDHLYLTNNFVVTHNSTTCLQICKNAIDDGRPVIYIDGESRLKEYNLVGIEGLDLDKIDVVQTPENGDPLSAEDFLKICESLIKLPENKGAVCVIDSCSSLVPRSELDEDPSATLRASLPKLLSHWIKKNAQTVVKNNIIMLIITHYITNTSGYGKVKIPDCGVMVQYQADGRIDIAKIEPWIEDGKKIGQLVHWKISCSSMGSSGTECISYIKFGKGIDKNKELIELATSLSIIEKGGAWYSLDFLAGTKDFPEAPKFQGQAKLYAFLEERKDIFDMIVSKVKEILA